MVSRRSRPQGAIEAACHSAGLLFVRYPVNAMNFPGADLDGLGALFDDPNQVVLAYCRTGTRCANLWVATERRRIWRVLYKQPETSVLT